jgi:hypothetical protein
LAPGNLKADQIAKWAFQNGFNFNDVIAAII